MYTKKNSIILSVLLAIVISVGITLELKGNRRIETLEHQNDALTEKLNGSMEIVKTWNELQDAYDLLVERWANSRKRILAADEPALTISYIHWLTTENKFGMEFDFALNSVEPQENISSFSFSISGEGSYEAIYDFIKYLTEHPILYKIENIKLTQQEENPEVLNYTIDIRGYFLNQKWKLKEDFDFTQVAINKDHTNFYDVFKPLVRERVKVSKAAEAPGTRVNQSPEKQEKVKDSELTKFKLLAVTKDAVYMLSSGKKLIKMQPGQTAYGGKLLRIDQQKSMAHFLVTQNGSQKEITFGLD